MIRILHIIDDPKFQSYVEATYENIEYHNTYCKFTEIDLTQLRKNFDLIIIHFLRKEYGLLFNEEIFNPDKIVWTMWGADAFQLGAFHNIHLKFRTKILRVRVNYKKSFIYGCKMLLKDLAPFMFDFQKGNKDLISLIGKIKHLVTLVPQDFNKLSASYKVNAQNYQINYVDPYLLENEKIPVKAGSKILLGNSAEFTNNHISVLSKLKTKDLNGRNILIPLGYGNKYNAALVKKYAKKKFGENVIAVTEFMPIEIYTELLLDCDIAIMPHLRQQALGNIVKLVFYGCNIYFYENSPVYTYLNNLGLKVSLIKKDWKLSPLSNEDKISNRKIVQNIFGKDSIHGQVAKMINSVMRIIG